MRARGGQNFKYSGSDNVDEVAWYQSNSGRQTHPVGQKKPNGVGLYDMSGNVWEWVWDRVGDYSSGSQTDPTGPDGEAADRVYRGGNGYWDGGAVALACRTDTATAPYGVLGFRHLGFSKDSRRFVPHENLPSSVRLLRTRRSSVDDGAPGKK